MSREEILISGYYGFGNLGDEAVLAGMLRGLRDALGEVPVTVLSASPAATQEIHNVSALRRTDGAALVRAMRRARLFLSGGGSLIQDVTSARSALYYLAVLRMARARVPRTMVYAQGVGPIRRHAIRAMTRRILDRMDAVTVRDPESAAFLRELGVQMPVTVAADPALLLSESPAASGGSTDGARERPRLCVAVRSWGNDQFVTPLAAALRGVADRHQAEVLVIPFFPAVDLAISRRLAGLCGGMLWEQALTPAEALRLLAGSAALIGLRLHALMLAAMAGVPPVGLSYDPKVSAFLQDLGTDPAVLLDAPADDIAGALERALAGGGRTSPEILAAGVRRLRTRAELAVAEAVRLYRAG